MNNIIPKERAWSRINQVFKMVKDNFLYLFFVPMFFQLIFNLWGFFPLLTLKLVMNPLLLIPVIIWLIFLWLFNSILMIRMVSQIIKWEWVNFWKDLQFALWHMWTYIKTMLYVVIFWYWIYVLLFLASVLLPILNMSMWLLPADQINLIWIILMTVWAIWAILKTYALFPVYFISITEWIQWKAALEKSCEITKDKFWRTFWNFLFIILWIWVIKLAFVFLLWMFVNLTFLNIVFWAFTSWVMIAFTFLLFKRYEIENNWWEENIWDWIHEDNDKNVVKADKINNNQENSGKWWKLIIVIFIILAIWVWWYFPVQNKLVQSKMRAYDAWTIADLSNIAALLQVYYDDNWKYPSKKSWECLTSWKWVWKDIVVYSFSWKIPKWKKMDFDNDFYNWVCENKWDIFYASLKKDNLSDSSFIICSWMHTKSKTNTSWDIFTALWKMKIKKYEDAVKKVWVNRNDWDYYCTIRP